jgi:hypothetical protein
MKAHVLAAAFVVASMGSASAYTSYLKPDEFWPANGDVAVEGAFASQFFTPAVAITPRLTVFDPRGGDQPFRSVAIVGQATQLITGLPSGGTYRISTGEQLGVVTALIGDPAVSGGWRPLGQGEIPAEGSPTTTLQTVTLSDVYVTRGGPTRLVVDRSIGRLAIRPLTHPNQVLAADGFDVEVLFDGAPLVNSAVVVYAAGDADTNVDRFFVTGADGHAHLALTAPGQYVIAARYRANAPAGSEAAVRSYTTTLTFEAMDVLPPIVALPTQEQPRRRSNWRRD